MNNYIMRSFRMVFGVLIYGVGVYLTIQANIGLAPWDTLHLGIANIFGLRVGDTSVMVGLGVLALAVLLGEKIGFGTVFNTVFIGKTVDFLNYYQLIPNMEGLFSGIALLLLGQLIICFGTYFYIGAGMGSGPRDSLMVALNRKLPRVPVGLIRALIEGTALTLGWFLGGKVGIGTLIAVFGIGFVMQSIFTMLRFDPKQVQHENLFETLRALKNAKLAIKSPEKA